MTLNMLRSNLRSITVHPERMTLGHPRFYSPLTLLVPLVLQIMQTISSIKLVLLVQLLHLVDEKLNIVTVSCHRRTNGGHHVPSYFNVMSPFVHR